MTRYIYCFVRKDLPKGPQIIQMSHACWEQSKKDSSTCPNMVLFEVKNELELDSIRLFLLSENIKFSAFYEPDYNNELTSICTESINENSHTREYFKDFKLYR